MSHLCHFCRMGGHDDGRMELCIHLAEERGDGLCIGGIQLTSRFVCQQDGGLVDEGATDGHTCLLATRELCDRAVFQREDAHELQQCQGVQLFLLCRCLLRGESRQQDVLPHRELRQQAMILIDKTNLLVAQVAETFRGLLATHLNLLPPHHIATLISRQQGAEDVQQRGLPHPRLAHDGHELALFHMQGEVVEHGQLSLTVDESFCYVFEFYHIFSNLI